MALGSTSKPADTVELQAFEVPQAEKSEVLRQLLYAEKGQTLIFARTKHGTERLAKNLVRDGFTAAMIHGDRTQSQRTGRSQRIRRRQVPGAGGHRRRLARHPREQCCACH